MTKAAEIADVVSFFRNATFLRKRGIDCELASGVLH
jgi:hypothetical protein